MTSKLYMHTILQMTIKLASHWEYNLAVPGTSTHTCWGLSSQSMRGRWGSQMFTVNKGNDREATRDN